MNCSMYVLISMYSSYQINLLREIREVAADVLFLQEVQADHYEQSILPELSEEGYDGHYKHKTREAMGATGKVIDVW